MYEAYWGLQEPPFSLTPDPRFLYLSRAHEDALMMLHYAITRNKGAAMLCGDIGLGKTTISRKLIEMIDPLAYQFVLIVNPILTPTQMLGEILSQLGIEPTSRNRQVLVQQLHSHLLDNYCRGKRVIVLIDEAHLIRSSATLEELRLLLNCQMNDQFLVSLVLLGQLELKKKIEKVPALNQRIAVRYALQQLDIQETGAMIEFRLRTAGYTAEQIPFTPDAIFEIHKVTGGTPRLISQAADNALLVGFVQNLKRIDGFTMHSILCEDNELGSKNDLSSETRKAA
ncbi:MAG TPA: AAA family ATPase [Fimbriimonadales bacterium]|nr:AAA family ATPase [Fimbriimonadales bacterium]